MKYSSCFNQVSAIVSVNDKPLKLADQFIYLDIHISSTETDVKMRKAKTESAIESWTTIGNLFNKSILARLVEGDPQTPVLIATTPRCRGERYFIP